MGIAGAGMSGLALLAKEQAVAITGCDNDPTGAADLAANGVEIWRGHDPGHVAGARAVVVTAAVPGDHPELKRARAPGVPVVRPADHLECYDGSVAALEQAFAQFAGRARRVIAGGDDAGALRVVSAVRAPVWRVGLGADADVRIADAQLDEQGSTARIELPDGRVLALRLRVPGLHNVRNAAAA